LKFFIISYVNSLERRKYVGLIFFHPVKHSMFTSTIEISASVFSWKKEYIKNTMQFYCKNTIRPRKDIKLCLRVEKWSRSHAIQFVYNFPFIGPLCKAWVRFYWFHHVFPILSAILTKYHYIILTDYPGIQFHRYIS
jgi:hypothetical protein